MKIENTGSQHTVARKQVAETQAAENARAAKAREAARGSERRDELTLSSQAQTLARARAALDEQPDVRAEKVQELKSAVEAGTYQVPLKKLAQQLMKRLSDAL